MREKNNKSIEERRKTTTKLFEKKSKSITKNSKKKKNFFYKKIKFNLTQNEIEYGPFLPWNKATKFGYNWKTILFIK